MAVRKLSTRNGDVSTVDANRAAMGRVEIAADPLESALSRVQSA